MKFQLYRKTDYYNKSAFAISIDYRIHNILIKHLTTFR